MRPYSFHSNDFANYKKTLDENLMPILHFLWKIATWKCLKRRILSSTFICSCCYGAKNIPGKNVLGFYLTSRSDSYFWWATTVSDAIAVYTVCSHRLNYESGKQSIAKIYCCIEKFYLKSLRVKGYINMPFWTHLAVY